MTVGVQSEINRRRQTLIKDDLFRLIFEVVLVKMLENNVESIMCIGDLSNSRRLISFWSFQSMVGDPKLS